MLLNCCGREQNTLSTCCFFEKVKWRNFIIQKLVGLFTSRSFSFYEELKRIKGTSFFFEVEILLALPQNKWAIVYVDSPSLFPYERFSNKKYILPHLGNMSIFNSDGDQFVLKLMGLFIKSFSFFQNSHFLIFWSFLFQIA